MAEMREDRKVFLEMVDAGARVKALLVQVQVDVEAELDDLSCLVLHVVHPLWVRKTPHTHTLESSVQPSGRLDSCFKHQAS